MVCPNEKLFSVPKAVELATGRRPHPATCFRWRQRGISGIRLDTWKVGGRRETSVEAVRRFIEATTAASDSPQAATVSRTNRQRQKSIDRAEVELDRIGV